MAITKEVLHSMFSKEERKEILKHLVECKEVCAKENRLLYIAVEKIEILF